MAENHTFSGGNPVKLSYFSLLKKGLLQKEIICCPSFRVHPSSEKVLSARMQTGGHKCCLPCPKWRKSYLFYGEVVVWGVVAGGGGGVGGAAVVALGAGPEQLSNYLLTPVWKGGYSKKKELALLGSKFFPFVAIRKYVASKNANRKSQKLSPLFKWLNSYAVLMVARVRAGRGGDETERSEIHLSVNIYPISHFLNILAYF